MAKDDDLGFIPSKKAQSGQDDIGFEAFSAEESARRQDAEDFDSPVLASLAGAARGATFGLSDLAGKAVGLDDELSKLQEFNPIASTVGEVGGAVGSLLVPGVGAANLAARAGAKVGTKLGGGLLARAAGTAVEGALFGAGSAVSKTSLAQRELDASDVGEIMAAEIGLGALTGGVLSLAGSGVAKGAAFATQKVKSGLAKTLNKLNGESIERTAAENTLDDVFRDTVRVGEKNQEAIDSFRAMGIEESKLAKATAFKDGFVRKRGEYLVESDTIAGRIEGNKALMQTKAASEAISDGVLDGKIDDALIPDSEAVIKKLSDFFDAKQAPFEEGYKALEDSFVGSEVSKAARNSVAKNIRALDGANLVPGSTAESAAGRYAMAIEKNATDINKLKQIRTAVMNDIETARRSGDHNLGDVLYEIKDKLTAMRQTWVQKNIERVGMERGESAALISETLKTVENIDKGYALYKKSLGDISEAIGLKRSSSPARILESLDVKDDQTLLKKLFNTQDKRSLELIKKEAPEIFDVLQSKFKNGLYKKAIVTVKGVEVFSPKRFYAEVKRLDLSEDMLKLTFGDAQAYRFNQYKPGVLALPEKFKKGSADWFDMQGGITAKFFQETNDFALLQALELAPKVQKAIERQDSTIKTQFQKFLDKSKRVIKPGVLQGVLSVSKDDTDRIERIVALSADPAALAEEIAINTMSISDADFGVAEAVSDSVLRAANYLASKAPKRPDSLDMFGQVEFRPSDAALAKFNRYLKAVDSPLSILDDLESGVLQPESVDAVASVYPKIYKKISRQAMESIGTDKKLSYSDKLQLATLLRMPTTGTMSPAFIAAMQKGNPDPMLSDGEVQQLESKTNVTGLKDLSVAQSTKTAVQKDLTRA